MSSVGYPDFQRYAQWFGAPLVKATGYAIGSGTKTDGPYQVNNWSSVIFFAKPTGGTLTVTVRQTVSTIAGTLIADTAISVAAGVAKAQSVVLLGNTVTLIQTGSAGGETVDYALVPSNTAVNTGTVSPVTIGFQKNEVLVGNEPTLDFVDATGMTWTLTDDAPSTRVKVSVSRPLTGWEPVTGSFTFNAVDGPTGVINTPSDLTGSIGLGDRFQYTQSATVKYGIVTAISATTVTVYGGTDYVLANAAISAVSYSHVKTPFGFPPSPAKWTETLTDTTNVAQATPTQNTWYNLGALSLTLPIGAWNVDYQVAFSMRGTGTGDQSATAKATLSTGASTETDVDWTAFSETASNIAVSPDLQTATTIYRAKVIAVTVKTVYYLNAQYTGANPSNIRFQGASSPTRLRAVCAYL